MKRIIKTVFLVSLLILLITSVATGANKKPKPVLPKAKTVFSSSLPASYTQGVTRSGSTISESLANELSGLYNQSFITPELARVYLQSPLIEWSVPVCNEENLCKVTISDKDSETLILEEHNVKDNSYLIDLNKVQLKPGMVYLFKVYSDTSEDTGKIDLPLQFYMLSEDEKAQLNEKLSPVQNTKQDDEYTKSIEEINFFVESGLWFELTEKLKEMISKYPDDKDLMGYKSLLYKLNME